MKGDTQMIDTERLPSSRVFANTQSCATVVLTSWSASLGPKTRARSGPSSGQLNPHNS
jgi:hypothetical protein